MITPTGAAKQRPDDRSSLHCSVSWRTLLNLDGSRSRRVYLRRWLAEQIVGTQPRCQRRSAAWSTFVGGPPAVTQDSVTYM